jgi:hypothetical protein
VETRRSLPGDRMIRIAATSRRPSGGLIAGCLYLPNGNPAPGPKFDYKLRLFERLMGYSKSFGHRRAGSDLVRNRKFASIPLDRRVCEPSVPREVSRGCVFQPRSGGIRVAPCRADCWVGTRVHNRQARCCTQSSEVGYIHTRGQRIHRTRIQGTRMEPRKPTGPPLRQNLSPDF